MCRVARGLGATLASAGVRAVLTVRGEECARREGAGASQANHVRTMASASLHRMELSAPVEPVDASTTMTVPTQGHSVTKADAPKDLEDQVDLRQSF